jgi:hypothetical protein
MKQKEKIETVVRLLLGQTDFSARLDDDQRPEHLRFDMGGNRDDDEGEDANIEIWKIFYPFFGHKLSIRRSYRDERPVFTQYVFTFHKGGGYLNEVVYDEERGNTYGDDDDEIMSYNGDGTVEILTDLIARFCPDDMYDFVNHHIKNMPEESLLSAEYFAKYGVQTIKNYC